MNGPDQLPSGRDPVCPRCGTPATGAVFCDACGLNLRRQGELPTAAAYAAREREKAWLREQKRERVEAQRQAAQEREAKLADHREGDVRDAEPRRGRRREGARFGTTEGAADSAPKAPSRARRGRRLVLPGLVAALAGGGLAAYILATGDDGTDGRATQQAQRPAKEATHTPTESASGSDSHASNGARTIRLAEGIGPVQLGQDRAEVEAELGKGKAARVGSGVEYHADAGEVTVSYGDSKFNPILHDDVDPHAQIVQYISTSSPRYYFPASGARFTVRSGYANLKVALPTADSIQCPSYAEVRVRKKADGGVYDLLWHVEDQRSGPGSFVAVSGVERSQRSAGLECFEGGE